MGNILLISEDNNLIERFKNIFNRRQYNLSFCCTPTSLLDFIEVESPDVFVIDERVQIPELPSVVKKIKSRHENSQILLVTGIEPVCEDLSEIVSGFITPDYSDEFLFATINNDLKIKDNLDKLSARNNDMAESLYRLNVLYNTSSQFAGTLNTKELLNYMTEGLDKSLSFDLTCIISFGFENEPVLVINSLYDLSEELVNALKLRSVLNYKTLFESRDIPFEIDDRNLKVVKNIKNLNEKFTFSIFQYDNMFAPIDLGEEFFGCIEIFKNKPFSTDDAAYFQTIVRQVSLPLKSAGLYKKIMEKNQELEKLERVKSDFISIVSHELRTPLTPIKNALSILSSGRCGNLGENASKFIDMAKRNVSNLTNIINDILDINKIEAGKMVFNYKNMNIHSVIENVKNNFDCVAKEHSIDFRSEEQENLPDIYADSQRLEQVLTNLVSNAIKFTPQGKQIIIKSELKNADDIAIEDSFKNEINNLSGDYILLSVKDEGIGIKHDNILKAFDMFTQIENSLTRKVGGTGLGLPIAKQLIKAHKGAIWCESEENKGSNFYVALPVASENVQGQSVQKEFV
ncbi:hybrid sensor histidine kinase/response regulator [bacterium]|nr:hybrid sensor histidine kinase/response regulator [bacterium]